MEDVVMFDGRVFEFAVTPTLSELLDVTQGAGYGLRDVAYATFRRADGEVVDYVNLNP